MKENLYRRFSIFVAIVCILFILSGGSQAGDDIFVNHLGIEFIKIPPGEFIMGSPLKEPFRDKDETQHKVIIKKSFYMQTTEVTVSQWCKIMGEKLFAQKKGTDTMPVVKVSFFDCLEFIKKLNKSKKGTYRLPREKEWEYACRAGSITAYSWGDYIDCSNAMYGNNTLKSPQCIDWIKSRGYKQDQPVQVKSYPPNAWGLYDMHGNVWEWCQDYYHDYLDASGHRITSEEVKTTSRVRRGGSWYNSGKFCRSANRTYAHPASKFQTTGFRLILEVP